MSQMHHFLKQVDLPVSVETAFAWHERTGAFQRLTPPWEPVEVIDKTGNIRDGDTLIAKVKAIVQQDLHARHEGYIQHVQFQDRQVKGPFASWFHSHRFERLGDQQSRLIDDINYELPMGKLGEVFGDGFVKSKLEAMFKYRHQILKADLVRHAQYADRPRLKILVTGASGLVGSQLCAFLSTGGHDVSVLVRSPSKLRLYHEIHWDIRQRQLDSSQLEGFDAIVHLAGENIAAGRWTKEVKEKIRASRVESTTLLSETLAKLANPPKVLVSASASGFYGDRGNEVLSENSPAGKGFLPETCIDWENATRAAKEKGIRIVHPRFGIILSAAGGALAKMLSPFKLGAGGVVGSGKQFWSWIVLDDVIYAIHDLIQNEAYSGPVNFSSPESPTNREFTDALGQVLSRPTIVPAPAFALKMMFGEMAEALLLASTRMEPSQLKDTGFRYEYPDLKSALKHVLGE